MHMSRLCIPKGIAANMKIALRKGEINIQQLADVKESGERRKMFRNILNDEALATFVNTEFEKALVSERQDALKNWAKKVFVGKQRPAYEGVIKKIEALNEVDAFNNAALEDLVMDKLGVNIGKKDADMIVKKATELQKLYSPKLGDPMTYKNETIQFFKKKKELEDIMQDLGPHSKMAVMTQTVFRGNMLFSAKSPTLNIISNTTGGIVKAFERRVFAKRPMGLNRDLSWEYIKMVNSIYKESGYDVSRMLSVDDDMAISKILGERIPKSRGRIGKFYEDIVFTWGLGKPDVAFSSVHFADAATLHSTQLAKKEGLTGEALKARAREILTNALSFNPSEEGLLVREYAVGEALRSTYTSKTWYDSVALKVRDVLNDATGSLNLGSVFDPFVKTGSNVIGQGIDASGVSAIRGLWKMARVMKIDGAEGFKKYMPELSKELIVSGVGMTAAFLLTRLLPDDDDFMGAYDPRRHEIEKLRNSTYNAIKIKGKWISLEYAGPLAVPIASILYARKYGKGTMSDKLMMYGGGLLSQAKQIPGTSALGDALNFIQTSKVQGLEFEKLAKNLTGSTLDFLRARFIPGFIYDVARGGDVQRYIYGKTKLDTAVNALKRTVPGLRKTLPEKRTIYGDQLKEESFLSGLFFGSRVKTEISTEITREVLRLDFNGQKPVLLDLSRTTRKGVVALKEKLSESDFNEANNKFRDELGKNYLLVIRSPKYENMDDKERKRQLDNANNVTEDWLLDLYDIETTAPKTRSRAKPKTYIIK